MTKEELIFNIDELVQQGLNSNNPKHWEASLQDILKLIRIEKAKARLEKLRKALRAENISYSELAELQSLVEYIEPGDVELLEAAGVPERISDTDRVMGPSDVIKRV